MNRCQAINSTLYCNECEVFLGSKSNRALHVLTKEHVKNLVRLGKRKPEPNTIMNEGTSTNPHLMPHLGVSKATPVTVENKKSTPMPPYGCFNGSKCLNGTSEAFKEPGKYDPNRQHSAQNPPKGQVSSRSEVINTNSTTPPDICKMITKSLLSCEVCNVILTKIPDYECHVKSLEHLWNMKLRKKGVADNFVKISTDSLKANAVDVSTNSFQINHNDLGQLTSTCEGFKFIPFPLLYCDACELLLNTPQQFYTHMNGMSHKSCVQKKGKTKAKKIQPPSPDKYYCFSCNLLINSFYQYKEHKAGKKHKLKCTQLLAMGIMIPPDEQLPEWNLPKITCNKSVRYPELYEKFVLEKQRTKLGKSGNAKGMPMKQNSFESFDCIKTLDATASTKVLQSFKSETAPHHIYRIQNKGLRTYSELPLTIVGNKYYLKNS